MKLPKKRFYQEIAEALESHGWLAMPGPSEFSLLLAKRSGELILSLALYESNVHRERVTAEVALGQHASLMKFPDAPHAWSRVGRWLTPEERVRILDPCFSGPGLVDAWWIGRTSETLQKILEAIQLAEPRFLSTPGLREEIVGSSRHRSYVERLRSIATTPVESSEGVRVPPDAWTDAAVLLLGAGSRRPTRAGAERVAADAWRTFRIMGLRLDPT